MDASDIQDWESNCQVFLKSLSLFDNV
jgi:hypothetical protein